MARSVKEMAVKAMREENIYSKKYRRKRSEMKIKPGESGCASSAWLAAMA
jgi:hypothetical protein